MSSKKTTEKDEDFLFLEQVLDKFYDFDNGTASKKRKKKKRKHEEEEDAEESTASGDRSSITDDHRAPPAGASQQQQTKAEPSGIRAQRGTRVEVVTFQDPRKRLKTSQTVAVDAAPTPTTTTTTQKKNDQMEGLSLEKARLEVHRFGITGYKKEEQRGFEQDRAIMLGARPPKKEYVNYRLLQEQIREKKQKVKEEVEQEPELKKKKKQKKPRDQKTSSSGSGSAPSGQMGRFKNGMLILSPKEIQKIKGNRRKK